MFSPWISRMGGCRLHENHFPQRCFTSEKGKSCLALNSILAIKCIKLRRVVGRQQLSRVSSVEP